MRRGTILSFLMILLTGSLLFAAPVKITVYSTSAETNANFERVFKEYQTLNPDVTVELIPIGVGQGQIEKFQSLLASGNAATLVILDPAQILQYKDKFLTFSPATDAYLKLANDGALDQGTFDGKLIGIPFTVQGYGLMYNKAVIDKVFGKSFDPSSINTRKSLAAFFQKLDAAGVAPAMFHGANWSLGAHFLGLSYSLHGKDTAGGVKFIEDLKAGKVSLLKDPIFMGMMDTFDLIKKYNLRKADPLVADYNKDVQDFVQGKSATFFMGDWMWAVANPLANKSPDYGVLPVVWSDNPSDYGNTQVPVSEPKLFAIDKSQNSPEQQAAARKLLEWLLTSKTGQNMLVSEVGFNLPYKNVTVANTSPMSAAIARYTSQGLSVSLGAFPYFPADYWEKTGASMQKYLVGKLDRAGLAREVESYWKSKAGK